MKELISIQQELKAPKNQYNKFGNYKYRSAEDILESVKPLLAKNKCTMTISDDIVLVGNRIYVKAIVTLKNEKGDTETTTAFAREEETKKGMDGSQITGAASSYARKYALNGLFCIDDTKDADATNDQGKAGEKASASAAPSATYTQADLDNAIAKIKGTNTKTGLNNIYYEFPNLQSVAEFINALSARKKELK